MNLEALWRQLDQVTHMNAAAIDRLQEVLKDLNQIERTLFALRRDLQCSDN